MKTFVLVSFPLFENHTILYWPIQNLVLPETRGIMNYNNLKNIMFKWIYEIQFICIENEIF